MFLAASRFWEFASNPLIYKDNRHSIQITIMIMTDCVTVCETAF